MAVSPVLVFDAVRTPFTTHEGGLRNWHPVDLLAETFRQLLDRNGIDESIVDHVIVGCASPVGEQALNIASNAALAAGWRQSLAAHTVDAQAQSGIVALHEAIARVSAGIDDVCVVGAVASTRVPEGATTGVAVGKPFGPMVHERFAADGGLRSPGVTLENLAQQFALTREQLEDYAVRSFTKAAHAVETGTKKPYLIELSDGKRAVAHDEVVGHDRPEKLKPLFEKDGLLTSATFALPASGAVALIICRADSAPKKHTPIAEIAAIKQSGIDVLTGDSGAAVASLVTKKSRVGRIEVTEDSAVTPLAFAQDFKCSLDLINPEGGALAIRNPYGVSTLASVVAAAHGITDLPKKDSLALVVGAGAGAISTATVLKIHSR